MVLVEGKTRIAQIIKYITQSSWSHSGIYIGDRVVAAGHPLRDRFLQLHGDDARFLVLEADLSSGVSAAPLSKYTEYNIRICRPYCLAASVRYRTSRRDGALRASRPSALVRSRRYLTAFRSSQRAPQGPPGRASRARSSARG